MSEITKKNDNAYNQTWLFGVSPHIMYIITANQS